MLGLWFHETEGAKFWMQVLAELRHRGVKDILICCVDGLTGFPEAIEAVFPQTVVQTCIVHLIRASLRYVPRRQYDQVTKDLRPIYTTNAIEALNRQPRKAIKAKGSFPSEDAARKLIYLAILNAVPQSTRTRGWTKALLASRIHFGDRLPN